MMNDVWTLEHWRQLVAESPNLGNAVWHDPDSGWSEARQHNTWLQMVLLMPGYLSNSDNEQLQVIRLLLEAGADPNRKNDFGYTALHHVSAIDHRSSSIAEMLLTYGADPKAVTNNGETSLDLLGADHDSDIIRKLLEKHMG